MDDPQTLDELEAEKKKKQKIIDELNKRRKEKIVRDLKKVLSFAEGRRTIWRILEEARVFSSCFHQDAIAMSNLEGRRDIGLLILSDIMSAMPSELTRMSNEAASDKKVEFKEIEREIENA